MKTDKARKSEKNSATCAVTIKIKSRGNVNIYNCSEGAPQEEPCPPVSEESDCPPVATGACVPASLGAKPKQSRRQKVDKLLANVRVPSALGAAFFQMARRQLAGKAAGSELEQRAFARLSALSPDIRRVLRCALDSFDALPPTERNRLFDASVLGDIDQAVTLPLLLDAFGQELVNNATLQVFGDVSCATERPGLVRVLPIPPGTEFPPAAVVICRVNGLRTGQSRPPLSAADFTPAEIQQQCHIVMENGQPKQVCEAQTTNCPGQQFDNFCLRVQDIEAGRAVTLEGVNFSSVDTKVRISDAAGAGRPRDVDAFVCGDTETQRTEIVDGQEVLIMDCRVRDRLVFRLPDDLAPGLYDFTVMVPNVDQVAGWGDTLFSNAERINVLPPSTARFQIASETLHCRNETGSTSIGSDEVGLKIMSTALFPDLTVGDSQSPNGGKPIRFGDVDSGETRSLDHLLFTHQQPILGAALSILGFEVDGEDAFKNQIDSFTDAFIDILKDQIAFLKDHLKEVGAVITKLASFGLAGAIAGAIAVVVTLVIDLFVALWAPADLIIEDAIGPTIADLVALTSVNFPLPAKSEHKTSQGIRVIVTPLEKLPQQYRERREYICDDEDSRYEIVLRYNRIA